MQDLTFRKRKRFSIAAPACLLALAFGLSASGRAETGGHPAWPDKPYRVLLVVERWSDPASVLIDHEKDAFQPVAALLKSWSVPFEILRLDQQHLDRTYLFERNGRARFAAVVWLADMPSYPGQNLAALEEAARAGTSLLVAHSRFLDPSLERVLGLKFKSVYSATDPTVFMANHFITRRAFERNKKQMENRYETSDRLGVEARGADVLLDQAGHPVLTANRLSEAASAVWLDVPTLATLRDSAEWREIFFRALVSCLGYLVQPDVDYARRVVLEIDDWGTADKGFLSYWRYPTPSEETLRRELIAPLDKRHGVVSANVVTGYVDRKTQGILSPWTQKFTDLFGVEQDYASTLRGLKAGVAAGVVEIQSHGWTHMEPDLESPPGPWWTAGLQGEASVDGWYAEFRDNRRGNDVPAIVQLAHMKRSREGLAEDLGQRPLSLRPGNGAWTKTYENHTGRVAAQAGFGLFHAEPDFVYYLDRDLVLDMTGIAREASAAYDRALNADRWPAHPDGPVFVTFHDRDIALQPGFVERLLSELPAGTEIFSASQYIGFLHAHIASANGHGWQISFDFDDDYCGPLARSGSSWRLWLADPWVEGIRALGEVNISVDGGAPSRVKASEFLREPVVLKVPPGAGRHDWRLEPAR